MWKSIFTQSYKIVIYYANMLVFYVIKFPSLSFWNTSHCWKKNAFRNFAHTNTHSIYYDFEFFECSRESVDEKTQKNFIMWEELKNFMLYVPLCKSDNNKINTDVKESCEGGINSSRNVSEYYFRRRERQSEVLKYSTMIFRFSRICSYERMMISNVSDDICTSYVVMKIYFCLP